MGKERRLPQVGPYRPEQKSLVRRWGCRVAEQAVGGMSAELHKIKAKIMALATKTTDRGCSEKEAMSAMEKVGQLLEQYNLTMEECDVREERCVSVNIPLRGVRSGSVGIWARQLAGLFSAKYYYSSEYTGEGRKR